MTKIWPEKDPEEIITATFDFTDDLAGENITAASQVVTVEIVDGVDADPSLLLNGAAQIQGAKVLQSVKVGLANNNYRLQCRIDTSGARRLVLAAILPVREA